MEKWFNYGEIARKKTFNLLGMMNGLGVLMRTGQEEGEAFNNLLSRVALTLMKGLSALILNRTTSHHH